MLWSICRSDVVGFDVCNITLDNVLSLWIAKIWYYFCYCLLNNNKPSWNNCLATHLRTYEVTLECIYYVWMLEMVFRAVPNGF